jgi:ribosomal protein S18 acetylase RimI-like enzyme
VRETLEGYAASGNSGRHLWSILQAEGDDVGCLLLADYPQFKQWELVYIGVVPEARGNGWGKAAVQEALWRAKEAGRERLVLAVDEANRPALAMYARAGFEAWNRRAVFLRTGSESEAKSPT